MNPSANSNEQSSSGAKLVIKKALLANRGFQASLNDRAQRLEVELAELERLMVSVTT